MNTMLQKEKYTALNNAVSSVEMEGYKLSEFEKNLCMEVLDGHLTKKDFINIMLERCSV